jgi:preprotein translocase subunit SecE
MNKIINYIKASIEELKKVSWPTKKETYRYTVLVVAVSLAVAAYLGGLDYLFTLGLRDFLYRL